MTHPDPAVARIETAFAVARRWAVRLLLALAVVAVLALLVNTAVTVETNRLWFGALHHSGVYDTILGSQILLLVGFGLVAGGASAGALAAVRRGAPRARFDLETQRRRARFRRVEPRWRRALLAAAGVIPGVWLGAQAAGGWQTFLLWRHAVPWHRTDPQFHRDISYFVDVYPFHRMVLGLLLQAVVVAVVVTVVAGYLYGAWRLRGRGPRITRPFKAQLSLLAGVWLLLRAGGFWLDRFALATSHHGAVTGLSYTDIHAALPARTVLTVVAALLGVALLANVVVQRLRVMAGAVAAMVVASLLLGTAWPALVHRFREQPSASSVELTSIARNQEATLEAFGLAGKVTTRPFGADDALHGADLQDQATRTAQIRLLDPNRVSPTFNVKQQLQAYYGFKSTLDVDRYDLGDGTPRDVAIAVRELRTSQISRQSWTNAHLVYTHGYGVVAAPTDAVDGTTEIPDFLDGGMPPADDISVTRPQVYFGQSSPSYSIVGQPSDSSKQLEFDHPAGDGGAAPAHTTYEGGGGVSIGSPMRRLLYAIKLHSPDVLFSDELNSASRLLTVRDPRARVSAVAPWLTLDGDVYPTVVDGDIVWVVDGYTSSNAYPDSEQVNLRSATTSTLTTSGSTVKQPNASVSYLDNSVKATVDAYTGEVHLYEWNQSAQPDPLLQTWEAAFPGLVEKQSDIPAALVPHLRYPQGLFDVQRTLLTRYHVTSPADFYSGNDFWKVPTDPTVAATKQLNAGATSTSTSSPAQASTYMTISADGTGPATFALSTPLVTLNRRNLAAFLSVDSEPGPDYGRFTLLELPSGSATESPAQVQNDIESSTTISEALTLQRGGNSKVVLGNLLAIPLGGRMLYVEPVYTQAAGGSSFPILRHVIATYGDGEPAFETTLSAALRRAVANGDTP
ncbi:MAG: UPF0182 family protein [Nocardioidaceae bacterium]